MSHPVSHVLAFYCTYDCSFFSEQSFVLIGSHIFLSTWSRFTRHRVNDDMLMFLTVAFCGGGMV